MHKLQEPAVRQPSTSRYVCDSHLFCRQKEFVWVQLQKHFAIWKLTTYKNTRERQSTTIITVLFQASNVSLFFCFFFSFGIGKGFPIVKNVLIYKTVEFTNLGHYAAGWTKENRTILVTSLRVNENITRLPEYTNGQMMKSWLVTLIVAKRLTPVNIN